MTLEQRYGPLVAVLIRARVALEAGAPAYAVPGHVYTQRDLPALRQKIAYSM